MTIRVGVSLLVVKKVWKFVPIFSTVTMDEIKELIYILNQNRIKVFGKDLQGAKEDSKMRNFFEGLESGNIKDDADALRLLYPSAANDAAYRKLKSQFRDRLFESLLQFDSEQAHFTDYQQAYYECNKAMMFVKILAGQNANKSALFLANKSLRTATKYEFTLLSLDLLSYLMLQYGIREGNGKNLREATATFQKYKQIFNIESEAEQAYVELMASQSSAKMDKREMSRWCTSVYERLSPQMETCDSYRLHLYGAIIGLMRFTMVNNYEATLDFCLKEAPFFLKKPFHARAALQLLYYHELVCWIKFRNFESGEKAAEKCFSITEEGTFNWFKYQELFLQLCFYAGQYERALEVIQATTGHPRFRFLPGGSKESWKLFEYYGSFISLATVQQANNPSFRYRKLKNELDGFSKDKGGMNAALVILRLLFLIVERKEATIIDEQEAMEQYCYRHLNAPEMERSATFIKMLLQFPLAVQGNEQASKKALKLLEKLQTNNKEHRFEVEIIPYEDLWVHLVEHSENAIA